LTNPVIRRVAAGALGANAALHLVLVFEYFGEQAYIGLSFLALAAISIWAAVRVLADDGRAWTIGAVVSAGAFVAFVVSRIIGLPSFHPTDWELSGIMALLLEAIVVGAAVRRSRAVERSRASSFA
jgi:hypothetical protein